MNKNIKKKIIETSYQLFKENGYDETTVNHICEACEITKPTFYRYLSSKEEILTYFFDQLTDELGTLIVNLANADNYYQQILCAFDLVINRLHVFGKELYAQLYITNLKNYSGTFDDIEVLKDIIVVLIKKAQSAHQIHNQNDPEELYALCSSICFGCGIKWCMNLIDDVHEEFAKCLSAALEVDEVFR